MRVGGRINGGSTHDGCSAIMRLVNRQHWQWRLGQQVVERLMPGVEPHGLGFDLNFEFQN